MPQEMQLAEDGAEDTNVLGNFLRDADSCRASLDPRDKIFSHIYRTSTKFSWAGKDSGQLLNGEFHVLSA